jgi:hypothetical protein
MPRRSRTLAGFIAAERAADTRRTSLAASQDLPDIASPAMQFDSCDAPGSNYDVATRPQRDTYSMDGRPSPGRRSERKK